MKLQGRRHSPLQLLGHRWFQLRFCALSPSLLFLFSFSNTHAHINTPHARVHTHAQTQTQERRCIANQQKPNVQGFITTSDSVIYHVTVRPHTLVSTRACVWIRECVRKLMFVCQNVIILSLGPAQVDWNPPARNEKGSINHFWYAENMYIFFIEKTVLFFLLFIFILLFCNATVE